MRRLSLLGLLLALAPRLGLAQAPSVPDSVQTRATVQLPAAAVTAYETHHPLLRTPAAVGLLGCTDLTRTDQTSLTAALNTLPGVRLEERAPGSYRLSIRGSTLRAPYGVRNVKVYLDEVPFTAADGTTLLNVLDPAALGRLEVLRGPAGSAFGAGTGGALRLETRRPPGHTADAELTATAGSYGLRRGALMVRAGADRAGLVATYAYQQADGYRRQSALARRSLLLRGTVAATDRQTLAVVVLYTNLFYELPGGISRAQAQADPRQVRPIVAANNSSIHYDYALAGLTHIYRLPADRGEVVSTIYSSLVDKDNPFTFNYERTTAHEVGGRLRATWRATVLGRATTFTAGAEVQHNLTVARTYDNRQGRADTLRSDDDRTARPGFVFGQVEVELPAGVLVTAGASYARTRYGLLRRQPPGLPPALTDLTRDFRPVVSPRVAVLKSLGTRWAAHASVSSGFSPPTVEELLPSGAPFNTALQAERGTTYEVGVRGTALGERLTLDVVGFALGLRQTIVSRRDSASVTTFRNAGTTRQRGLEAQVRYALLQPSTANRPRLDVWAAYTFSAFRFGSYATAEGDFGGNRLTGAAPHVLVGGLDGQGWGGFYAHLTTTYQDRLPLNDANTVWAAAWWTTNAQLGWRHTFKRMELDLFAGLNNATDTRYSLGNDFNDARANYYEPAPGRNWYGGLRLKL